MRGVLIFVLLTVLVSGIASAELVEIHDDWHQYKDTFTVKDDVFQIELNQFDFNILIFTANNFTTLVNENRCKIVDEFKYCYEEYDLNHSKKTVSEKGILVPGVHIIIYKDETDEAKIVETNKFDKEVYLSKTYRADISLKNTGVAWANLVNYEITIPDGVEITNKRDFEILGKKLVYSTNLAPNVVKDISFDYKPTKFGEKEFKYTIFYEDYASRKNKTGSFKVKAPNPYKITATVSSAKVEIGNRANLDVKVENTDIEKDLVLKNLIVRSKTDLIYSTDSKFYFSRAGEFKIDPVTIRPGDEKSFRLGITPRYTGKYDLAGELELESQGFTLKDNFTKTVEVLADGIFVDFYLNKNDVLAGSDVELSVTIKNTNNDLYFNNFKINITSDIYNEVLTLEQLIPVSTVEVLKRKVITVPLTESDMKYTINSKTTYKTSTGQEKTLDNSQQITSTGSGTILKITQDVRPTTVNPGDEIIVEVFVKNLKENYFDMLKVDDIFPEEMSVVVGDYSYRGALSRSENKRSYLYKIQVPENYRREEFTIQTIAELPSQDYRTELNKTIKVNVTNPIPVEEPEDDEIDVITKDDNKEEKPGFFKQLINSIEDFFVRLFGGGKD